MSRKITCSEVFGGINNADAELTSGNLRISLFAKSYQGESGGDIHYVGQCSKDIISRLLVADVIGHGDAVSFVSQQIYRSLHEYMDSVENVKVFDALNRQLKAYGYKGITSALVFAYVDDEASYYVSSAGHPAAYLCRGGGQIWDAIKIEGEGICNLPLGAVEETTYSQLVIPAQRGDRLFLYTDGLLETAAPDGSLFGVDKLIAVLRQGGNQSIAQLKTQLLAELANHAGSQPWGDDVTFLLAELA